MWSYLSTGASGKYEALSTREPMQSTTMEEGTSRMRSRSQWTINFWVMTTIFFASLSAWLGAERQSKKSLGSFDKGWNSELESARPLIEIEHKSFKGAPHFYDNGSSFFLDELQYVGEPSREIDHAWALLTYGRFFLLTEDEARNSWGERYTEFWSPQDGGYITGIEMLHTLHCLDHIRKGFYPEVYKLDQAIHGVLHKEHCINHLRQIIMCNADMTPIPSRWYGGINQNYIDSDRPHTCRNFGKLRAWVTERYNGSLAVPSQNPPQGAHDEWKNEQ